MLSNLPDDCIMEVFKYLNMNDMDEMRVVSRRINFLEKYQSFGTPTELKIVQNGARHGFILTARNNAGAARDIKYFYGFCHKYDESRMCVDKMCKFCDNNTEIRVRCAIKCAKKSLHRFNDEAYIDYGWYKMPKKMGASTPQLLLTILEPLLDRYAVTHLTLVNVRIDPSFIPIFEKMTSVIKSLRMTAVSVKGGGRNALSAFVRSPKLRQLVIQDAPEKTRFSPSKGKVLALLTRFDCFVHRSLAIQPQWLPELFETILSTNRCGEITVGITEEANDLNIQATPPHKHRKIEGIDGGRPKNELINTDTGRYLKYMFVKDGDAHLLWMSFGYF